VCPTTAISKDPETGIVAINQELCTGCEACAAACPYGPETVHFVDAKAVLCDLCDGNPQCARICQQKAIAYMPTTIAVQHKKRRLAEIRRKDLQLLR
jgi:Fe-S-cluster-containing dehydrogenase component